MAHVELSESVWLVFHGCKLLVSAETPQNGSQEGFWGKTAGRKSKSGRVQSRMGLHYIAAGGPSQAKGCQVRLQGKLQVQHCARLWASDDNLLPGGSCFQPLKDSTVAVRSSVKLLDPQLSSDSLCRRHIYSRDEADASMPQPT